MPILVNWEDDSRQVLVSTYTSPIHVEDMVDSQQAVLDLLNSVSHKVIQLVDMSDVSALPSGILGSFSRLARHPATAHPKSRLLICILDGGLVEQEMNVYSRVFSGMHVVHSLDEAHALIDAELAPRPQAPNGVNTQHVM